MAGRDPRAPGAVLVTGGAGYVAPPAVRRLVASGRRVVVLDDLSTGHRDVLRFSPFVEGDVADETLVRDTIRTHGVTAIMHFAAKALVAESVEKPRLYDRWNRGKTTVLARVAAEEGVRAFVFSSTCAVYGTPDEVPIPEDHPRRPINPYGVSKVGCEDALFGSGMPTAALRYFNAAGAEPEHGLGERHDPETHLIPLALGALATGVPLTVYGTDYPTPDGTCIRDYVHVADLAEAHILALARLEAGGAGGAWNLGTGHGVSVRQVLRAVERVVGRPVPVVEGPRRPGDPPALVARSDRARKELRWTPRRSDLDRVVGDAAAFSRSGAVRKEGDVMDRPRPVSRRAEGRPLVVAIDGPAGVGKSTIARRLAADLGFAHLDSGALYRAATLAAIEAGAPPEDAGAVADLARDLSIQLTWPEGRVLLGVGRDVTETIRSAEVTRHVARVAEGEALRSRMVDHQRRFAARERQIVAEGRDLGTVVFPDATIKVYLDGEPRERARRRLLQDQPEAGAGAGIDADALAGVEEAIRARDQRDRTRRVAPLSVPEDAWVLDTTNLTLDEVFEAVRSHVRSRIPVASPPESPA